MKKVTVLMALLMLSSMAVEAAGDQVNYEKPYYNKPAVAARKQENYAEKNSAVYKKSSGNDYLQKYNIDDLEDAPWLHGGKRNLND